MNVLEKKVLRTARDDTVLIAVDVTGMMLKSMLMIMSAHLIETDGTTNNNARSTEACAAAWRAVCSCW